MIMYSLPFEETRTTNDDGGREGYALVRRFRRMTPDLAFIRI